MITVLMSVYNSDPAQLRQAIDSILAQTFTDFEFLICDDGSTGDGRTQQPARSELLRQATRDSRIRLCWEPHRGLTKTLNRGLELARGEWIARQDADDWSDPERLQRQMERVRENQHLVVLGSNAWMHREDGGRLWPTRLPESAAELRRAFANGNPFVHGSVLFRASAARMARGYREAFPCSQDYDFFWRLSEAGEVANLPMPLYHYRFTAGSVSVRRAEEQAQAHLAAKILAAFRSQGVPEDVEQALAQASSQLRWKSCAKSSVETGMRNGTGRNVGLDGHFRAALKQADHRLLAGDFSGALAEYFRLIRKHPERPLGWGKAARGLLFTACPPARRACF